MKALNLTGEKHWSVDACGITIFNGVFSSVRSLPMLSACKAGAYADGTSASEFGGGMPKFGAHIIFAEEARARRPDLFADSHDNALRLGAIGPDTTLFIFDPATSNPDLRRGITATLDILETIQDIKEKLKEIATQLTRPVDDLADWLTGGLTKDLSYTVNAAIEALVLAAKLGIGIGAGRINVKNPIFGQIGNLPGDFIKNPEHALQYWTISLTDNFGFPFRMFGHPFTSDGTWKQPVPPGDYSDWWWMDMLHYRKTGQFASRLLENAAGAVQTSYAKGYMTHVGGDICGHPFINALVGGPFRNHAYRHLVVETLADTWLWSHQGRGDVLGARFDSLIDLDGTDEDQVARLVVRTMRDVYQPPMVPRLLTGGYPTEDEWLSAYKLMQQYLRLSTSASIPRPAPPPDTPKEIFEEIKELLKNNIPGPFPPWNGNITDFLKSLFSWFGKGLSLLVMLATLPVAVVVRFLTVAPRWIIYLFNLAFYYIISAIRTMLCLTGWGYCGAEDFVSFGFLKDWITTPHFEKYGYPFNTLPNPKLPFYWLVPPARSGIATIEREPTFPMAPARGGIRPDWMIDPNNTIDFAAVMSFMQSKTPADTRQLEEAFGFDQVCGNAVDFSIFLLDGGLPVPDFDLDGDRGIGYFGWEVLPPNEKYV